MTLWHVARHEITRGLRRRTFLLAAALLTSLLAVSFVLEVQRQLGEQRERAALQGQVSQEWKQQPDRHPHRMAHYGSFAFRPPSSLSFFDPGVEPFTGNAVYLEAHKRNTPSFSAAAQGGELVRFGRPTAAFVLQWLLPLLIFCMTFDSVAGEREAGTWSLALSQGARPRTLIGGKVLGNVLLVLVWVLPAILIAASAQWIVGVEGRDLPTRGLLLVLVYVMYIALCVGIGVVVSSLHTRGQAALTMSLSLWIACWVVLPRVATELAARAHPVTSRAQLEAELSHASHAAGSGHGKSPETLALTARTLAQYGVQRVEDLPININGLMVQQGEERTSAMYDRFYQQIYDAQRAQARMTLGFGLLSPVILLRAASMALAGSDSERYEAFLEQAERHRFGFIEKLNDVHAKHLKYAEKDGLLRARHQYWADFPAFHFEAPALAWASSWSRAALGLLAWCLALLAFVLTRREQVR